MSKHTPGPWDMKQAREPDNVGGYNACIIARVTGKPQIIAVTYEVCDYGVKLDVMANARLISAAPDMAEALRRLLKWVEPIAGDNRDDAAEKEELASVEAARVSLKKAGVEW